MYQKFFYIFYALEKSQYNWDWLFYYYLIPIILELKVVRILQLNCLNVLLLKDYLFGTVFIYGSASLMAQMVRNLPAMQETWVWYLGQKDILEKGKAIHSSILTWRIPWIEEPGTPVHGVPKSQTVLSC